MTDSSTLADLSARELHDLYVAREVSPVAATAAALARVEDLDDTYRAFAATAPEAALEQARESEARYLRGTAHGPLDGIPTAVKDVFDVRGMPTRRGSLTTSADPAGGDSAPVAALRAAGAVLVGKATTAEFGWKAVTDGPQSGVTRHPEDPELTPGGSSGGSATAIGLGMATLSLGTDGGGSIRVPAAFCGQVGLKPSFDRIPVPAGAYAPIGHAGLLGRTVADVATLLAELTGAPSDPAAGSGDLAGLRVGVSTTLGYAEPAPAIAAAVEDAGRRLAGRGARVVAADPGFADPVDAFHTLLFAGAAASLAPVPEARRADVDPGLLEVAAQGARMTATDYVEALVAAGALRARMEAWHREHDLLLCPTAAVTAFEAGREAPADRPGRWTSWAACTYPFNMTHQPAISVPGGRDERGRPIGVQLVGPVGADELVLRAAAALEGEPA